MCVTKSEFSIQFFQFLASKGIGYAVLHGWDQGFEGEISDIDFVVEPDGFSELVGIAREFCLLSQWRLVQVLRHETTSAYLICVNSQRVGESVALDACSDYQKMGRVYFSWADLLMDRLETDEGVFRVSDLNHILYRVAKASAKGKSPRALGEERSKWPPDACEAAKSEMVRRWDADPGKWTEGELQRVIKKIKDHTSFRSFFGFSSLRRILRRFVRPDGLYLRQPHRNAVTEALEESLGPLFRRTARSGWNPLLTINSLIRSGVVFTESPVLYSFLPKSLKISLRDHIGHEEAFHQVVGFLEKRCTMKEKI